MSENSSISPAASLPPLGDQTPLAESVERNQKGLIAVAVVIALAAAGYAVYRGAKSSNEHSAGEALSKASSPSAFASVTSDYSGTPAAGTAQILLADSLWEEGKKDEAIATLQKFVSEQSQHPLVPTAQANLASKLAATGKTAEATELFEKIADNSSAAYIAPYALISLGDLAKATNQPEKAKEAYQRVQSNFANSHFVDIATSRLQILNAKAPVEIDAPAAPESDVPEANLLDGQPGTQIPFGTPTIPSDGGANAPGNP